MLGPLDSDLDARAARLERLATSYADGRVQLPVMELIVVLAQTKGGVDGMYRSRVDDADVDRYLAVARRHRMLLLLDMQPGRADPLREIKNAGFKLFYAEDARRGRLMTPAQVLALRPRPELVTYE